MEKLVADECVDLGIIDGLRQQGYEVYSIIESNPGIDDDEVLNIANERQTLLLTEDKDFGELTFRLKRKNHGILLIRLIGINSEEKAKIVINTFRKHFEDLQGSFSVLTVKKLRIRKTAGQDNK